MCSTITLRLEERNICHIFSIKIWLPCFEVLNDSIQMLIREIKAFGIEVVGIRKFQDTIIMGVVIPIVANSQK